MRAQAEWRAQKRREFEEKKRRREERDSAIALSKAVSRSKPQGMDVYAVTKKFRTNHTEAPTTVEYRHHLSDHAPTISLPSTTVPELGAPAVEAVAPVSQQSAPATKAQELMDQRLAQARWREQKRKEIAERNAKRKTSRRTRRGSALASVHVPPNTAVPPSTVATEGQIHAPAAHPDIPVTSQRIEVPDAHPITSSGAMPTCATIPGNRESAPETIPHGLQAHPQTQPSLTADVLGADLQDQELLGVSWQALDPLAPSQ